MKYYILIFSTLLLSYTFSYSQSTAVKYPGGEKCRFALSVDSGDTLWAGSRDGLQKCFNNSCDSFTVTNSGITNNICWAVSVDSSDNIWAGGPSGLSVFNHTAWTSYSTQNSGLPSDSVNAIVHTPNGTWIGTSRGLAYFDGTNWSVYTMQNSGILNDSVIGLSIDNTTLYISHRTGLSRFNGSWTTWNINFLTINYNKPVMCLAAGRLWISDTKNIYYLNQNVISDFREVLNDYKSRYRLYQPEGFSVCGFAGDAAGNLIFTKWNEFNQRIIYKVTPSLKVEISNIKQSVNITTQAQASLCRDSILYVASFSGGLVKVIIDSSTFVNKVWLKGTSNDYLDVNNTTARLLNRGDMHWDPVGQIPGYISDTTNYKCPLYSSAIWLGGIDQGGQLHTAAMTYRQQASADFWYGPLDTITGTGDTIAMEYYDRFWKIDADMISNFQSNFANGNLQNGSYTLPEALATWPGNANGNFSTRLAPFVDLNTDGIYNPYDGDYPELSGHQSLWWIFNDTTPGRPRSESGGLAFGFEIQGKSYGYSCSYNSPSDEVMNNTTFYQYKITNRSQNTYHDVYIGLFTDLEIGNAADDYVGCDSLLNTYFGYNGDNDDEGGGGYGLNPPMMNVTVLKGPTVQAADGIDNDHNGLTDEINECAGLSGFAYFQNVNSTPTGNPYASDDYYDYLTAHWLDGLPFTYGGDGRNFSPIPVNYQYSGVPYGNGWSMPSAGLIADDMRAIGASGPFTIAPGESRTIDFAYIFTRDSLNPNGLLTSIAKNTSDVQKIINGFNTGNYPCLTTADLPETGKKLRDFNVYPNPVRNILYFNKEMLGAEYEIYTVTGQLVKSGEMTGSGIATEKLQPQLYIIKAIKNNECYVKRFVKL